MQLRYYTQGYPQLMGELMNPLLYQCLSSGSVRVALEYILPLYVALFI